MKHRADVAVVGAGILGLAHAYEREEAAVLLSLSATNVPQAPRCETVA